MQKEDLELLPSGAGVYLFKNIQGEVIYIGKASNIKKRVESYFTDNTQSVKTALLVQNIKKINYIIVNSEHEAFILEDKLIKKYQPFYNIQLKDDKSYPYIVIEHRRFPRIYFTRNENDIKGDIFGPYSRIKTPLKILKFIQNTYKLRSCNLDLSEKNILKKKFSACLEYHIKKCHAPCIGLQSEEDYMRNIQIAKKILQGKYSNIISSLKEQMFALAKDYKYEEAQELKEMIENIKNLQRTNSILDAQFYEIDALNCLPKNKRFYFNYTMTNEGCILNTYNFYFKNTLDLTINDAITKALEHIKMKFNSTTKEILCNYPCSFDNIQINSNFDKDQQKKKLFDLSRKNLENFIESEERKHWGTYLKKKKQNIPVNDILILMQKKLSLPEVPIRIESFDNSHLGGTENVSAVVCFINGIPYKKEYRLYKLKKVKGVNDYAAMQEVIYRRYKRLLDENRDLPNIILVDGGKGQLNAAYTSLKKLHIENKITLMSIAKNQEELFFFQDKDSIQLDKKDVVLQFLQYVRDETHRFVITFQKKRRVKVLLRNPLENLAGFGKKTIQKLLLKYRTLKSMYEASDKELEALIGKEKTKILKTFLFTYLTNENKSLRNNPSETND